MHLVFKDALQMSRFTLLLLYLTVAKLRASQLNWAQSQFS